jgi:RNA polymerase sigma-70 factor (ECF subfamily)
MRESIETDLNTNEDGIAVHDDCYTRNLAVRNSSDDRDEDFALLARVGRGDQRAIASLYDRHSTLVYSVALRVCRDSASAEEVLQNIFMQI